MNFYLVLFSLNFVILMVGLFKFEYFRTCEHIIIWLD